MSSLTADILDIGDERMLGIRPDGRKIWLEGPAVPGDRVELEPEGKSGRVTRILVPAPNRLPPRCPHFDICPGCQLQPLPYAAQLELKAAKITETLRRIGGFDGFDFRGLTPSPDPYGTRNKLDFSIQAANVGYQSSLGFIPVSECPVGAPILHNLISPLTNWLRNHPRHHLHRAMLRTGSDRRTAHLLLRGLLSEQETSDLVDWAKEQCGLESLSIQADWKAPWETLHGPGSLTFTLADVSHTVAHDRFFQIHDTLADTLVRTALDWLGSGKSQRLLDLFSGSGAFTLPAARQGFQVLGLDSRPGPGPFQQADLRRGIPKPVLNQSWQVVMTDPPRAGMEKDLCRQIRDQLRPERILYISCNPATLARDLQRLCANQSYRLTRVQGFDLFPHTTHVETLAELVRR
ncbi:MAG: hypothetical protein WD708_03090 [Kiritimatiellia bacterium]